MGELILTDVRKTFGGPPVLTGVTLTVPAGSLTAILGPSGCGKTTLLRLIAGFDNPTSGTITLDGRIIAGAGRPIPPQQRRIGYVAQEGALFPHLTVAANVTFGLPRAQRRRATGLTELLTLVGLDAELASRLPSELSGGQQQRVALARALCPQPDLVLLDEPFSALDAGLRQHTRAAVATALRATGATTVLVTHDQDEALSMADYVAVLGEGILTQTGTPQAVYRTPADAFTATFIGDAMLLACTVIGRHATTDALGSLDIHGPARDGAAVAVVRPEHLDLVPATDTDTDGSGLAARVTSVEFYGHDAVVHLTMIGTNIPLRVRARSTPLPQPGDRLRVRVNGPITCIAP